MSFRKLRLETALDRVMRTMRLRRPQKESLQKVHQILIHLDHDVSELTPNEIVRQVRELHPLWSFANGYCEATFDLATGVGKTRLMGAIATYMHLAGQASTFVFLAPRTAIIRKLTADAFPNSPKYLFGDIGLVADPTVWHAGNLDSFRAPTNTSMFHSGPVAFILSPQSITGSDRRFSRPSSEESGLSMAGYLAQRNDVVVFADESHHLGATRDADRSEWSRAINALTPQFVFGMTATPPREVSRDGAARTTVNVLHSYDLATCLKERLYTKDVNIIVDNRPAQVTSDGEWDHHTLDFALDRLSRKEQALAEYRGDTPFPPVRPVLLVCAETTEHADNLAGWLRASRGLGADELLVTHSGRSKSDAEVSRLVEIEQPSSRVRVVVNVHELTEGWDVTNVYVIAPLRAMGTFAGALQTVGRGLRLPAGRRVDDKELDTLDVLCFGRATLEQILTEAKGKFGDEEEESPITVTNKGDEGLHAEPAAKTVTIDLAMPMMISMPRVSVVPEEPDLDFDVLSRKKGAERTASAFRLGDDDVANTSESLKYDFHTLARLAASRVISSLPYLSEPLHRTQVEKLIAGYLKNLGAAEDKPVALDWLLIAKAVEDEIDLPYRKKTVVVQLQGGHEEVSFRPYSWRVPESYTRPLSISERKEWLSSYSRLPIGRWKRCVHKAAAFDSKPEWIVAKILDASKSVKWWARNDPAQLRMSSPIGRFEPDFVLCVDGFPQTLIVLEVKQDGLWTPEDSDARVKSRAAEAWCKGVTSAGGGQWEHWVLLEPDILESQSFLDLRNRRIEFEVG